MRARATATLSAVILISLFLISPPGSAAVASGVGVTQSNLLMYFDLANPAGISGSTLTDLSGNSFNGTIYQTSSQPSLNTGQGKYLNFSGSAGYVDIPDISSGSNWTGLSVSFYANMGTRSVVERIFDFGIGQQNNNIWVGMGNANRMAIEVFRDSGSPGWCESANDSVVANEWAHWTAVLDGSTCKWYKNNVLSNSITYSYLPLAKTLTTNYIGDSNWSSDPSFEGGIGDLAIYKSALTDAERLQNYNAQTDLTPPSITDTYLSSPENRLSISTLNAGAGTIFSIRSGYDTAKLSLSSSGVFAFQSNPNYEANNSYFNNFQYSVNARAMDSNGNYTDFYLQVSVTDVSESSALSTPALSGTPFKGVAVTITVTPSGDGTSIPGKITYLYAGKRINGCFKKSYSGTGNSTCTWKPAMQGIRELSVTFTPTNTNYTAASTKKNFQVFKRTTNR